MNLWILNLLAVLGELGHSVKWVHSPAEVPEGDLCFMLSCGQIVKKEVLQRKSQRQVVLSIRNFAVL